MYTTPYVCTCTCVYVMYHHVHYVCRTCSCVSHSTVIVMFVRSLSSILPPVLPSPKMCHFGCFHFSKQPATQPGIGAAAAMNLMLPTRSLANHPEPPVSSLHIIRTSSVFEDAVAPLRASTCAHVSFILFIFIFIFWSEIGTHVSRCVFQAARWHLLSQK